MQDKKKKQFEFSVIMTIYNIEKYLEEAIDSVINQSLDFKKNIEIILVNDGSPDNSSIICEKYKKKYPQNIIYIEKENGGVSSARNVGLDVATGKIINFLDSDDYFSKNAFEKVTDYFKRNTDVDVVALNLINFENSSGSWVNQEYFKKTQTIDMIKEPHFMQCQVGASFIKREVALKYRYDEKIKIHEDSHYLYRIFRDNPKCGTISDATYWHRIRNNGTSATQTIKHKNNVFNMSGYLLKDLIEFYKEKSNELPDFLQTFIILEFNYYVLEKISTLTLDKKEKEDLKSYIENVINNISPKNIKNHPFISEKTKNRYLLLKGNISLLYKKNFLEKPELYLPLTKKVKITIKRIINFTRRKISFIKRKIINILKLTIGLNKLLGEQNNRIMELEKRLIDRENDLNEKIVNLEEDILNLEKSANYNFEDDVNSIYYFHSGSNNCGCEALIKTITKLSGNKSENSALISFRRKEDIQKNMHKYAKYIVKPILSNISNKLEYLGDCKFNYEDLGIETYIENLKQNAIAYSIGGDNYCYGEYVNELLAQYNRLFHKHDIKTALLGCSIEPSVIADKNVQKDLNLYDLIIARESLTYNALIEAGLNKNTKLIPDTAFLLEKEVVEYPESFKVNNTIGINISPLINSYTESPDKIYNNYKRLMQYILNETDMNIALIAHVYWEKSNDLEPIERLYNEFCNPERICIIKSNNASKLKGYISSCKIFVGARTHAIIAAYSSCVPTLAVGYSIKSKGIAKDLFGEYENYVISVNDFIEEDDLLKAYKYIENNYYLIKQYLEKTIPEYIKPLMNYENIINELKNTEIKQELPTNECTGCTACFNVCPKNCIKMQKNKEGFKHPVIDYKECIRCGKCLKVCPALNKQQSIIPVCYAAKALDEVRKNSSSGGVFFHLAEEILNKGGIVVGAAFDDNMNLKHIIIDNKEELFKLQGSKYLQSDLNDIYKEIKNNLNQNKLILFSGTPCQVKGLKLYLEKEYNNLYTVDVICHGTPSPLVYKKYIEKLENKNKSTIKSYDFRNKDAGWKTYSTKIEYTNGNLQRENFSDNIFMKGFLRNLYLRESCYTCSSNKFTSGSDITLGDFWGIQNIMPEFDDDGGCNLVFINSKAGEYLFNIAKKRLEIKKVNLSDVIKYNKSLYIPAFINKNRSNFFDNIEKVDIEENIDKNLYDDEV